jgi:hypothetical protein
LFATSILKVERPKVVDFEQPAKVRSNVLFKEARWAMLPFLVSVAGENN